MRSQKLHEFEKRDLTMADLIKIATADAFFVSEEPEECSEIISQLIQQAIHNEGVWH